MTHTIAAEWLAFGAYEDAGVGGHFLGAAHTLEGFRDCFYRPLLSSSYAYERWMRNGGKDTAERAGEIGTHTHGEHEEPAMDPVSCEELDAYVIRRREEFGD
jgi:trimethylamine--corrinoid protein Co-methyltransferase